MRYALPLAMLASPALAHEGAHLHPHGVEGWVVGLSLLTLVVSAISAVTVRKSRK